MANKISAAEVAIKLNMPKRTLLGWIKQGKFLAPNRDFSGYYWWDEEELDEYIKKRGLLNGC